MTNIKTINKKMNFVCCEKSMHRDDYSSNGIDSISYVCLSCGYIININSSQMDEEELQNLRDNYDLVDVKQEPHKDLKYIESLAFDVVKNQNKPKNKEQLTKEGVF